MHLSKYCLLVPLTANLLQNLPSATCKMMVVLCLQVNGFAMAFSPAKRQLMDNMLILHHLCDAYKILNTFFDNQRKMSFAMCNASMTTLHLHLR
jgi:hypothetical protein